MANVFVHILREQNQNKKLPYLPDYRPGLLIPSLKF